MKKHKRRESSMKIIVKGCNMQVKSFPRKKIKPKDFLNKYVEVKWVDICSQRDFKLKDLKDFNDEKALAFITDFGKVVFITDYFLTIANSIGMGEADIISMPISNIHTITEMKFNERV